MQDILTCAMGLDVHRDIIVARLAKGAGGGMPPYRHGKHGDLLAANL